MITLYRLEGHEVVPCATIDEATAFFAGGLRNRRVAFDLIDQYGAAIRVSTVFLGIDHRFLDDGPPLVFETMVFWEGNGRTLDNLQWRYSDWDSAAHGHQKAVDSVRARHQKRLRNGGGRTRSRPTPIGPSLREYFKEARMWAALRP